MYIEVYQETDREVIAAIWLTSNIYAHPSISEDYWIEKYSDFYHTQLPESSCFISKIDGSAESFICVSKTGHIISISTAVSFRQKGHGVFLMNHIKKITPANLTASVYSENIVAVNFFTKAGFEIHNTYVDEKTGISVSTFFWNKIESSL